MSKRFKIWLTVLSSALCVNVACNGGGGGGFDGFDSQESDTSETDTTETDTTESDTPEQDQTQGGTAGLSFRALLGDGFKRQFETSIRPFIPEDTSMDRGDLVLLLCDTSDATCESPVFERVVDKSNPEEWSVDIGGPAPIQSTFGPDIQVGDLPEGTYNLMVVYDSLDSQKRGYGWNDTFETEETAWGGKASPTDLMLSDQDATDGVNPPPVPVEITLTSGEVAELGDLMLSHYHEHKISDPPAGDVGTLVVGNKTDNSIRLVDLSTYELLKAVDDGSIVSYDFQLTDSNNQPITGTMCNVIEGPGDTVFAIFTARSLQLPDDIGYAVHFDPVARQQVTDNLVVFPVGEKTTAGPCRAVYHQHNGEEYLFAAAADSSNQGGQKGFWYANISDLASGGADIMATVLNPGDDVLFDKPLHNVVAYQGQVFIGSETADLAPCNGHACAFIADFDTTGRPTLRYDTATSEYEIYKANLMKGDVKIPELANQTISCQDTEQGVYYFGLEIATFKKTGQELLIFGNCHAIDMFDLATGEMLDFDPVNAGNQGLNAALFGGGYYDFDLSPDGDILWAMPANKSRMQYYAVSKEPIGDITDYRVTLNRHALLPIDLSASVPGDAPRVHPTFTQTDKDGFEGLPDDGIQDHATPANDPGIDVQGFFLKAYYLFWNTSFSGSLPKPLPVGPTIAAANGTVWLRGAGADTGDAGQSGLGVGTNLSVLDLDRQRLVVWPPAGQETYLPFVGLKTHNLGYDLTPGQPHSIATAGLVYIAP